MTTTWTLFFEVNFKKKNLNVTFTPEVVVGAERKRLSNTAYCTSEFRNKREKEYDCKLLLDFLLALPSEFGNDNM